MGPDRPLHTSYIVRLLHLTRGMMMRALTVALLASSAAAAPSAVVVGAGVGGLYTAARLAKSGVAVTLVEQNGPDSAGGRLGCEEILSDGRRFRFESGPSLLLLPSVYREALSSLGLNPDDHLRLARCNPSYAVHFDDGRQPSAVEIGGDAESEASLQQAMEAVEPGSYEAYADSSAGAYGSVDEYGTSQHHHASSSSSSTST